MGVYWQAKKESLLLTMDISVVIPTYNRLNLLPSVINSWREVHRVTKCNYEIIFSDDGSQDGTVQFLREVKDLPLTILENDHGGPARARNLAVARAIGDRLLFMGDDIFPHFDLLNQHWAHSKRLGENVAVLGEVLWHRDVKVNHLMHHITQVGNEQFSYNRLTSNAFTDFRHFYTCNISVDRKVISREPCIFDERFYKVNFEDIELGFRLSKRGGKIFYLPAARGYHYHPYTAKEFYRRQENAGEMAVVFSSLHPEIDEVLRVSAIQNKFSLYQASQRERPQEGTANILADVMNRCEEYEDLLETFDQTSFWDRTLLKDHLSNIYFRLFRFSFESGVLVKLFPAQSVTIAEYLEKRYFGWDFYWETKMSLACLWGRYGRLDKKLVLSLRKDYSLGWRFRQIGPMKDKWLHLLIRILREAKRLVKGVIRRSRVLQAVRDSILMYRLKRRVSNSRGSSAPVRLGVILSDWDEQANELKSKLLSDFGTNICTIYSTKAGYILRGLNTELQHYRTRQDLPVDYLYEPQNIFTALSFEHLKNVILCLNFYAFDFVLVSHSLLDLPHVSVGILKDQLIYSVRAARKFPDIEYGLGKVLRLMPSSPFAQDQALESLFPARNVFHSVEEGVVYLGRKTEPPRLKARAPFMTFAKRKTTIFVWPVFMAVGGVERNTIEIMRRLSIDYHFVLMTMERLESSQGSLHHQLKDITSDVYDLAEIAPQADYLPLLYQLKQIYEPDLIWICNGSPWLVDNALNIRELFSEIPIVDQQVYDTKEGWVNRYPEKGIQSFDRFIAINKKIEQVFYERIKIPREKVDLIYHAIDASRVTDALAMKGILSEHEVRKKYGLPLHMKYFLFVGRMHPQKRPLDLLKLAAKRQRRGDDSFFIMIGNGPLSDEVDEFISRHRILNVLRINFVENPVEIMLFASGIIFTSAYEGLPVALLEALAVRVPAFCTDVGDIGLILEEYGCGLTVPCSGDIDEYEQAFDEFLCDLTQYRRNLEINAARILDRFSGESIARRYASVFDKSMNDVSKRTVPRSNFNARGGTDLSQIA